MATIFRSPLVTRIWRVPTIPTEYRNNQLIDVLVGRDTFFQGQGQTQTYDYPNPPGYTYSKDLRVYVQPSNFPLFNAAVPFKSFDWPNPRGYTYPTDLRTYVNPLELALLGKDQFFTSPGQGPNYDYPNPLIKRLIPIDASFSQGLSAGPLPPPVQNPFSQDDWPNPLGYTYPISLRTGLFYYVYDTSVPGAMYDWPNPNRPVFSIALRTNQQPNLFNNTLFQGNSTPEQWQDWPNPNGYRFSVGLRTQTLSLLQTTLDPGVSIPITPIDIVNPRVATYSVTLRGHTNNLLESTLAPTQGTPFFGSATPNPTLRKYYLQRSETSSLVVGVPLVPPPPSTYFTGTSLGLTGVGH